jgi:hypothetical protein
MVNLILFKDSYFIIKSIFLRFYFDGKEQTDSKRPHHPEIYGSIWWFTGIDRSYWHHTK